MDAIERVGRCVPAGGGDTVWLVDDTYALKIPGAQTGGAFALLEKDLDFWPPEIAVIAE